MPQKPWVSPSSAAMSQLNVAAMAPVASSILLKEPPFEPTAACELAMPT